MIFNLSDVQAACFTFHVEHPDRIVWYYSLIKEWTTQTPMAAVDESDIVVWINPYTSQAGFIHAQPTGVRGKTLEACLERLANDVYDDLQMDLVALRRQSMAPLPSVVR
ncbi:hypothetical protein [Dictyobacter aurantiacus]|uniref:Uncharacterized protein n=1 Tax=Dictyobacter aurantiacus TaxID=1936993 RepID=A0A401ZG33_9CHLR|nr:hypothetical protein [Dictyobacter aurantiacus]GCE05763.1 hypothetical protein KDAU_30920 [Dictyobacter aurantiacus]